MPCIHVNSAQNPTLLLSHLLPQPQNPQPHPKKPPKQHPPPDDSASKTQTTDGAVYEGILHAATPYPTGGGLAVELRMVPKSSAREGGACALSEMARAADTIRDAIAKARGEP